MFKNIGYVIVKYLDISDKTRDDDIVIKTERLQLDFGEHVLEPKEFEGYDNIPFRQPKENNLNPCDLSWEEPIYNLVFGQQQMNISSSSRFYLVEFYYVKKEVV